jgi:septum formation protein
MPNLPAPLCLASASPVRAQLLKSAGVDFEIDPADIDEGATKATYVEASGKPSLAAVLAEKKGLWVARRRPKDLVLGADQTLTCDGIAFDKPADLAAARETLSQLRGRRHTLTAAVSIVRGESVLWQYQSEATLEMRTFSDSFLDQYLAAAGTSILTSVGAYRLESHGAQLFSAVEGDYFTVLGLPLIPVLNFLRGEGVLVS